MMPTGIDGTPGVLTIMYTGVNKLPLHYTLPYQQGAETLNLAQSWDGGATWRKCKSNPIHPEPPVGLTVSGWRDPYVAPSPSLDRAMGRVDSGGTLYGIISGGIKGRTPTAFLYAVNKTDLTQWIYICPLVDLGLNHIISRWSGDMGVNWECANFMTFTDSEDETSRDFIVVGGEGSITSKPDSTFAEYPQQVTDFPREARSLQWMCGTLRQVQSDGGNIVPKMDYVTGGRFDHGCLYGVNTFFDPVTSKQIAWGWITEEDLPQNLIDRQNWSGLLSLPRELSLQCLRHVKGALVSNLNDITSIEIEPISESTCTVRTLGISPARHLEGLRQSAQEVALPGPVSLTSPGQSSLDIHSCRFELSATLSVSDTCSLIGLSIFHTKERDPAFATIIYLTPATETLTIERPNSTHVDPVINTAPENAPFTLFTFATMNGDVRENLEIRAWFDESVLEVFANGRCTFATRIYPATKRCWGVRFWAEDKMQASHLIQARAWDGLRADIKVS
jgi:beta-fructofuranosidase